MSTPNAPLWLVPSAPGMMSNRLGSNLVADSLGFQARFSTPDAGLLGGIRVKAVRTSIQGSTASAQLAWDSGWNGGVNVSQLPTNLAAFAKSNCTAVYNGRVYVYGSPKQFAQQASGATPSLYPIMSAPINGANVGTWRYETAATDALGNTILANSMTLLNGRLYITGTGPGNYQGFVVPADHIYWTTIASDGSLGVWTDAGIIAYAASTGYAIISNTDGLTYANITMFCTDGANGPGALNQPSLTAPVSLIDGSVGALVSAGGTSSNLQVTGASILYDSSSAANPYSTVFVIGGDNGVSAKATVYWATVTPATGQLGAWNTSANVLPVALTRSGCTFINNGTLNRVYILGGSTAVGTGATVATVYYIDINLLKAANAWTTGTPMLLARASQCYWPFPDAQTSSSAAITNARCYGSAGGASGVNAVLTVTAYDSTTVHNFGGTGQGLSAGDMGTGGVSTLNPDNTQDVSFLYGAFGPAPVLAAFLNGDAVQVTVQFINFSSGDASAAVATQVTFGQPPTISSQTLGLTTTAEPTASMKYNGGAGGGPQASWRLTITDPVPTQVFDSLSRLDLGDTVKWVLSPTPPAATVYTGTFTVKATDIPMNTIAGIAAQSASATATATWSHALVSPGRPELVTSVASPTAGKITVGWQNPGQNLLTPNQASIETDATGWAAGANTAIAQSAAQALDGTKSLSITSAAAGSLNINTPTGVSGIAVTPGVTYTALAASRAAVTPRNFTPYILWFTAAGAAISESDGVALADVTTGWTRGFVTAVAPPTAAFAAIGMFHSGIAGAGEVHYGDCFSLAKGVSSAWALPSVPAAATNRIYYRKGPVNLLSAVNASFETGIGSWLNDGNITISQTTVQALDGTHSLQLLSTAGGDMDTIQNAGGLSGMPVTSGVTYTALASLRAAVSPRNGRVGIAWYDANGSQIGGTGYGAATADTTTGWTQVAYTFISPANAAFALIFVQVQATGAGAEIHYLDQVSLASGTSTVWTAGGQPWTLLKDNTTADPNSAAQTIDLMDEMAFLQGYEFYVASLSPAFAESGKSGSAASTISIAQPTLGGAGYTVMLHIAGNGVAQHAGLALSADAIDISRQRDVAETFAFGAKAPSVTYGTLNFRRVHLRHLMRDDPTGVEAILTAAAAGATICFRDRMGDVIYCGLPISVARSQERMASHSYLTDDLVLVETSFVYAP